MFGDVSFVGSTIPPRRLEHVSLSLNLTRIFISGLLKSTKSAVSFQSAFQTFQFMMTPTRRRSKSGKEFASRSIQRHHQQNLEKSSNSVF